MQLFFIPSKWNDYLGFVFSVAAHRHRIRKRKHTFGISIYRPHGEDPELLRGPVVDAQSENFDRSGSVFDGYPTAGGTDVGLFWLGPSGNTSEVKGPYLKPNFRLNPRLIYILFWKGNMLFPPWVCESVYELWWFNVQKVIMWKVKLQLSTAINKHHVLTWQRAQLITWWPKIDK